MLTLWIGFYLGGFFYVSMLVQSETDQEESWGTILVSGAMWPYGLYQILSGKG